MTLLWALMCRSENVCLLRFPNIRVSGDCLVIRFPRTKTDQEGKCADDDIHVFANSLDPTVCTHTALGVFLMSAGDLSADSKVFPGDAYKLFAKAFKKAVCLCLSLSVCVYLSVSICLSLFFCMVC
jgi:hypothetical protein